MRNRPQGHPNRDGILIFNGQSHLKEMCNTVYLYTGYMSIMSSKVSHT